MSPDRERARRVLAQLLPPESHKPSHHCAILAWVSLLTGLAGLLSPEMERNVQPWRDLEARRRAGMLEQLRTSPVAAPVAERKRTVRVPKG